MTDKNGVEIKTGCIVEITGAYFKTDNGLYFVDNAPGDPSWSGSDCSLKKISKRGKISKAIYSVTFWPIGVFVSDRFKAAEARRWNAEHAQIEVTSIDNMSEVAARFQERAEVAERQAKRAAFDFGESSEYAERCRAIQAHYAAVAQSISN